MQRNDDSTATTSSSSNVSVMPNLQRFTVAETCKILKIERTTLWRRFAAGEIEGQRDGRLYFTAEQIAAYQARLSTSLRRAS